ncbi:replication initiation factor domain-containing protein [Leptospira santarosai]|nr:replication initiation factor domain-containing protein [Leptospira santarosai]EMP02716.1 replication initiation factor [Leptospira santarosai str. HAI1380]MDI7216649.1 replication initiation factor domain-containing protein [Leptospira santarosai]UZN09265.1 replication initiation factor domain-containing protein [Leptospira santarosai]
MNEVSGTSVPDFLKHPFVDWLSFTIEYSDLSWSWLKNTFGELKVEERGYHTGHTHTFRTTGDVFGAYSPNRRSQKIYVSLSSKALFNLGLSGDGLSKLIQDVVERRGRFTRLDLAQDDYDGYLNLDLIYNKLCNKEVLTRFRGFTEFDAPVERIRSGSFFKDPKLEKCGYTIYIGAMRKSNVFVRIYDKKLQVGSECAWPIWNRLEFQLNHEAADQYCNPTWNVNPETGEIQNTNERFPDPRRASFADRSFPRTAYYYIKFLETTYVQKMNDLGHLYLSEKQKQLWSPCIWWTRFLKTFDGKPIGLPKHETGLEEIDNWLKSQVSGAVSLMSDLFGDDYYEDLKTEGTEKQKRNRKYQRLKEEFLLKQSQEKLETAKRAVIDEVPF